MIIINVIASVSACSYACLTSPLAAVAVPSSLGVVLAAPSLAALPYD